MSDGTVRRYILQDGRSVNVARYQDANGGIHILTSGCEVVSSSDYDALRTQARGLAEETDELLDTLQNLMPDLEKLSKFAHVRKRAQAVLKEGR